MAFASIISSAIGIILLIITAYVLVGGVLTTTQIAMNAQSDMTAVHMKMLGTAIEVDSTSVENSTPNVIYLNLLNSGSEPVDMTQVDVFLEVPGTAPLKIPEGSGAGTWSIISPDPDIIQWRPTEVLNMSIEYGGSYPVVVHLTTGNGISAFSRITGP